MALGEQPYAFLADVVAGAGVLLARIAEPDDEPIERSAATGTPIEQAHVLRRGRRSLAGGSLGIAFARSALFALGTFLALGGLGLGELLFPGDEHGDDRRLRVSDGGDAGRELDVAER